MVMYLLSYVSGFREDFGTSQAKLLDTWSASKIEPEDWRSIIQKDPMENTSTTHDISQDQYSFQVQGVVDYTWKKNLTIGDFSNRRACQETTAALIEKRWCSGPCSKDVILWKLPKKNGKWRRNSELYGQHSGSHIIALKKGQASFLAFFGWRIHLQHHFICEVFDGQLDLQYCWTSCTSWRGAISNPIAVTEC